MAPHLSPYLTFSEGKARAAMTFYQQCFGGELQIMTVAETPVAAQCPAGMQDQVMHSQLNNGNFVLMATDMTPGDEVKAGNDLALALDFHTEEDLRSCFDKLSEGGKVLTPLKVEFWGGLFGMAQDKFGKVWMFQYNKK